MAQTHDVDFSYVREHADFGKVLAYYGIETSGRGEQVKGRCPFHDDRKPSLTVNTDKNLFHCFACEASGNIVDFVVRIEDLKPRPAAIRLAEICGIATKDGGHARRNGAKASAKASPAKPKEEPETADEPEVTANKPLTFTLKLDIQPYHPWLESRGISPGKVEHWQIGLATRGTMEGRLCIPIHNAAGELVAYCGRYPADDVPEGEDKYRFPSGFRKELELFNLWRYERGAINTVVLVESFISVIVHSAHDKAFLSPMGRSISPQQVQLLKDWGVKRVAILFDGDEPGRKGAEQAAGAVAAAGMWAKVGAIPDGMKPHRMTYEEIIVCFNLS